GAAISDRSEKDKEMILTNAKRILREGFHPKFWMIDKSAAERAAILEVWPKAVIRVCQFHVIQAITRYNSTSEGKKKGRKAIHMSEEMLGMLLVAFRSAQRCRDTKDDPWKAAHEAFNKQIRRICRKYSRLDLILILTEYFDDNWWCEEWRNSVIDAGLPQGMTRDGNLNTNNWVEALFRMLDQVFLQMRKNKR
ncbi:hypothetical protein SISSUDRAFT_1038738, partial [Sistotremastrum suecicum HHB10207 ss-3]